MSSTIRMNGKNGEQAETEKFHTEWYGTMMENGKKTKRKENQEEDDEEANEPGTDDDQDVPFRWGVHY